MSNKPIIAVENLSKKFIISHESSKGYTAIRDVITNKVKSLINPSNDNKGNTLEEFWALRDINFEIQAGDRVGIIGRNGAGKSTLLKILSRITPPTEGKITINGRVSSLLEVGTGFHPELTGRENIYLNGAILGMSRLETHRKFDEIVDFAEVEKFLDTPVKRYSSGMYVRLAFAVAAHLEPEILIVDEVLAVGDAQFQKKCLGKMDDVSKNEGRTVLFVSHNMIAIQNLTNSIITLDKGRLSFYGDKTLGVIEYEKSHRLTNSTFVSNETSVELRMISNNISAPSTIDFKDGVRFEVIIDAQRNYGKSWINIVIDNNEGVTVGHIRNDWYDIPLTILKGKAIHRISLDQIALSPGIYSVYCRLALTDELIIVDSSVSYFEVTGKHIFGSIAYPIKWEQVN